MEIISTEEYQKLASNGVSIDVKYGYPKVIIHDDGTITKLWPNKFKLFSSANFSPYSTRFIKAGEKLKALGIATPEIIQHAKIQGTRIRLVRYHELPGTSIRELLHESPEKLDIPSLAKFIYELHEKGILFRSIHLGNVIQCSAGGYGLIDFTDTEFHHKPLPAEKRAMNLSTPLRYEKDLNAMKEAGLPSLLDAYLDIYRADEPTRARFQQVVSERKKR